MTEHKNPGTVLAQTEFDLLPPDPWGGRQPDPPPGALCPTQVPSGTQAASAGRPPGRANNRAADHTSYIARRHGSPLEHAARFVAQPLEAIAREIGGTKLDAWYERQAVMEFLGRYVLAEPAKPVMVAARGHSSFALAHYAAASAASDRIHAERVERERFHAEGSGAKEDPQPMIKPVAVARSADWTSLPFHLLPPCPD
jgi:hypothetical protein